MSIQYKIQRGNKMKKFLISSLKLGLGIFIAFILLGILAVFIAPDSDAPDDKSTIGETSLKPIKATSSKPAGPYVYADGQWISTVYEDTQPVTTDVENVADAGKNVMSGGDIQFVAAYSENLYESTETAILNSDKYPVSPDLQPTKDEYNQAMENYNMAAVCMNKAVTAYNNDDIDECTDLFDDASSYLDSGSEHFFKASDLLEAYNEENGY